MSACRARNHSKTEHPGNEGNNQQNEGVGEHNWWTDECFLNR